MTDYKSIIESPFYEKANKYVEETGNNDCTLEAYIDGATEATKELEAQIEKMKCCYNCKHSRTEYEHCKTEKSEKWEMKEK